MSTTNRKARKRAGIPFTRTPKTVTPPADRALPLVQQPGKEIHVSGRAIARLTRRHPDLATPEAPAKPKRLPFLRTTPTA